MNNELKVGDKNGNGQCKIVNDFIYDIERFSIINKELILTNPLINNFKDFGDFNLKYISPYDIGAVDPNYCRGLKYPISYIRWDYRRNIEYFISIVEEKIINLNYFNIKKIKVDSFMKTEELMSSLEIDSLFLFQIQ